MRVKLFYYKSPPWGNTAGSGLLLLIPGQELFEESHATEEIVGRFHYTDKRIHVFCIMRVNKAAGCQAAAGRMPARRGICCAMRSTGSGWIVAGRAAVVKKR